MSGVSLIPLSVRTLSPSGVVGPLAASQTNLTLSFLATSPVITFSRAAGIKISHSLVQKSSAEIFSASG